MKRRNIILFSTLLVLILVEIVLILPQEVTSSYLHQLKHRQGSGDKRGALNSGSPQGSSAQESQQDLSPANSPSQQQQQQQAATYGEHNMLGLTSVGSKRDKKEWELEADKASKIAGEEKWLIENVRARFFAENGVSYKVIGKKGEVDIKKNNMVITGDVVTESSNGYVYRTTYADYDSAQRLLTSPGEVGVWGPPEPGGQQLELKGEQLTADMKTNKVYIARKVRAQKTIRDGQIAHISSRTATLSSKEHQALFKGRVVIDVDRIRIMGPEAYFIYGTESNAVESMTVVGGVKLTDFEKTATSQKVEVLFLQDKFIFTGQPKVFQKGDVMTGDRITLTNGGREVLISKASANIESIGTYQNPPKVNK